MQRNIYVYRAGGNINHCDHCGEKINQKLKLDLPQNPSIYSEVLI